jgi:hypothetical protein
MDIKTILTNLINVPSIDLEDSRRRRLLNILLIGVAILPLPLIPISIFFGGSIGFSQSEAYITSIIAVVVFIVSAILLRINRNVSGRLASIMFLLILPKNYQMAVP